MNIIRNLGIALLGGGIALLAASHTIVPAIVDQAVADRDRQWQTSAYERRTDAIEAQVDAEIDNLVEVSEAFAAGQTIGQNVAEARMCTRRP